MYTFFESIFHAFTTVVTSIAVTFGLLAVPIQQDAASSYSLVGELPTSSTAVVERALDKKPEPRATKIEMPRLQVPQKSTTISVPEPEKAKTYTLPSGAIIDTLGNILNHDEMDRRAQLRLLEDQNKKLQEQNAFLQQRVETPQSHTRSVQAQIEIASVKIVPSHMSANFEWKTNIPTSARVFVSGQGVPTRSAESNSGFSTRHLAGVPSLQANTSYDFEIEAVSGNLTSKYSGNFRTISLASLEVFSPSPGKGLGRTYMADPNATDDSNYVYMGLIIKDEKGDYVRDTVVTIIATDTTQNKTLNGTGNATNVFINGVKTSIWYYPLNYEFKTSGKHTITFTANGMTESVTVEVGDPVQP